jgi:transcriptional adapter 3
LPPVNTDPDALLQPDFTEKVDDPIATALRQAQAELRQVVTTNKARKARLIAIARDRLGYQEYIEVRESIDKNINALFSKLQKKDAPKLSKKKKKADGSESGSTGNGGGANGVGNGNGGVSGNLAPCPAAIGFNQDDDQHLLLNDQLKHLVDTRRQWVDTVGVVFEQKEQESPGRIWGLPKESVYKGIEPDIQRLLLDPGPLNVVRDDDISMNGFSPSVVPGKVKVKGKERAGTHSLGGDEMDLT